MARRLRTIATIAAGVIVVAALLVAAVGRERTLAWIFGPIEIAPVDFETLTLSPKPNQFLVCPPDFCSAEPHLDSPTFAVPVDVLRQRWLAMLADRPRIEPGAADDAKMQYDYIQRTALMRYPDSITVRFIALDGGRSSLAIYSRSHYGRDDFGVNEVRVRDWLTALEPR